MVSVGVSGPFQTQAMTSRSSLKARYPDGPICPKPGSSNAIVQNNVGISVDIIFASQPVAVLKISTNALSPSSAVNNVSVTVNVM